MNVALAKKVLTKVRKHPERHNQDEFVSGLTQLDTKTMKGTACGTTACLAGWAGVLAAPKGTRIDPNNTTLMFPDGSSMDIERYATEQLDLTSDQAGALFYCFDNATAIKRLEYLTTNPVASYEDLETEFPSPTSDADW